MINQVYSVCLKTMDKDKIVDLMRTGEYVSKVPEETMLSFLRRQITYTFVKNGVHRSMAKENFEQEVAFCAKMMLDELKSDKVYSRLRDSEVEYIMSEGLKGRLGTDKDIVLTYKSILRWIEAYVVHPIRREAVDFYVKELAKNKELPPKKEMSDDDCKRMIATAWEEYKAFKDSVGSGSQPKTGDNVKSVGEVFGFPFTCYDYGGIRLGYLKEKGYANEEDSLVDVFERAYGNGGKFEKVSQ